MYCLTLCSSVAVLSLFLLLPLICRRKKNQVKFSHTLDFDDYIAMVVLCFCFLRFLYPFYFLKIKNSANGLIRIRSYFCLCFLGGFMAHAFIGGIVHFYQKPDCLFFFFYINIEQWVQVLSAFFIKFPISLSFNSFSSHWSKLHF